MEMLNKKAQGWIGILVLITIGILLSIAFTASLDDENLTSNSTLPATEENLSRLEEANQTISTDKSGEEIVIEAAKIENPSYSILAVASLAGSSGNFFEGFESNSFSTNNWTLNSSNGASNWSIVTTDAYAGTYHAQAQPLYTTEPASVMQVNIDTSNYTNITLSYYRRLVGIDVADEFKVKWWNGTNWTIVEETLGNSANDGSYVFKNFSLNGNASNKSSFMIKFECTAGATSEYCRVDNIQVNGSSMIPPVPDTTIPVINSVSESADPIVIENILLITANVTDNAAASSAWIEIDGINITMTQKSTISGNSANMLLDNFESGSINTKGWNINGSGATWTAISGDSAEGSYHAEAHATGAGNPSYIEISASTAGYSNITFSYERKLIGLDAADSFSAEWFDGASWTAAESVTTEDDAAYVAKNFTLPAIAGNNANFKVRFKCECGAVSEYCKIDNVNVSGLTSPASADLWIYSYAANSTGVIDYSIYANDTSSNNATKVTGNFSIVESNITIAEAITELNGTRINTTFIIEDSNNVTIYNETKNVHYKQIGKGRYKLKIRPVGHKMKEIEFSELNFTSDIGGTIDIDDPADNQGWNELYAFNPIIGNGSNNDTVTIILNATAGSNVLYKCPSWNFTTQNCTNNDWVAWIDIRPGQEYNATFLVGDPGLAEGNATFFEGFESNNLSTNNWTLISGPGVLNNWTIRDSLCYAGTYCAYCIPRGGISYFQTNVSTLGYKNITLSYARQDYGLDAGEYMGSDWHNGTAWIELEAVESGWGYQIRNFSLPQSANNNPNFAIRFKINADANSEYGYFDNILVSGTEAVAPNINFTSPTEISGSLLKRSNILVNVTASDASAFNITIRLYNSTGLVNSSTSASSPFYLNLTGLANGIYYFNATACDNANNCNSTSTRNVTIDTTSPNATILNPANGTTTSTASHNFTLNISDNNGLSNATLKIYNSTGLYNQTTISLGGALQATVGVVVWLADGVYSWFWEVIDLAGNFFSTATTPDGNRTITIDATPPASITSLSGSSSNSTSINWSWINPIDSDFAYTIVYLNSVWKINTTDDNYTATGLNPHSNYTLTVHTIDTTGNLNNSDANSSVSTLNTLPLATNIDIKPDNPLTTDNLTCNYTYSDSDGDSESGTTFRWFKNDAVQSGLTTQTINHGNTSNGETWICEVTPKDGIENGIPVNSTTEVIGSSAPSIESVIDDSNTENPTNVGNKVNFTVDWSDVDQPTETARFYICNSSNITSAGCSDKTFCNTSNSIDDPASCEYTAQESDNSIVLYFAKVCDDENSCSSVYNTIQFYVNHAPSASSRDIKPDNPLTTDNLTCNYTYSDSDGDSESGTTFRWFKNDAVQSGLTTQTINHGNTTKGEVWKCEITPKDTHEFAGAILNSSEETITNSVPSALSPLTSTNDVTNKTNATIYANWTFSDDDAGDSEQTNQIKWYKNNIEQAVLENMTEVGAGNTSKGEGWRFSVRVNDGANWSSYANSSNITIKNSAPGVPTIDILPSSPDDEDDLVASITTASNDSDNDTITYSYAWYKNSILQAGLTTNTVSKVLTSIGENWSVTVTPNDGEENGASASDNVTIAASGSVAELISLISPADGASWTSSNSVTFSYNTTMSPANCSLVIDNTIRQTDNSITPNTTESFIETVSNGAYSWKINCTSSDGTVNSSELRSLTVSYTAPSNGGGGGGSHTTVNLTSSVSLELTPLNSIIMNPGESRKISLGIRNSGTSFLNKCRIKGDRNYDSWIRAFEVKDLSAGQKTDMIFEVLTPKTIENGRYEVEVRVSCDELNKTAMLSVDIIQKKLDVRIVDARRQGKGVIKIIYAMEELAGEKQNVSVVISLMKSDKGKVAGISENRILNPKTSEIFETYIELSDEENNLELLLNANSEIASAFAQEHILLESTRAIGFTIFKDEEQKNIVVIFTIILAFVIFAVIIVRRIINYNAIYSRKGLISSIINQVRYGKHYHAG